jgi:hypothetical protein
MRGEEGLTIVEVVVAGLILVAGALGVLGIIDSATRNTFRAEQSQVVSNVLQGEVERLREIPYSKLALTALPLDSGDPEDPNSRVASTSFYYTGRDETGLKPIVYNGAANGKETIEGGTVDPGPDPFQVGDVTGDVYRYVVWDTCPSALCQDKRHLKRVIVAVRLDDTASGGFERRYQEVQGQVVDPEAEPSTFPNQEPGGSDTIPWTLFLTDTPCFESERQPHPESEGSHSTHNTRGDCTGGLVEENSPGAPDLLWPEAPEGEVDYKYDYSIEIEPQPAEDEGLQILPGSKCASMTPFAIGVASAPDVDSDVFRKVHRWLSPPIPESESPDDVLLTGEGTLSLWTRTINEAVHAGRVCAWLFVRKYGEATVTDALAVNLGPPLSLHFSKAESSWPSSGWTEVSIPLSFGYAGEGGALPLEPGSRLGLAISVDESTPTGLQFLYDEPSFDSRLEVQTVGAEPPGA